MPRRNVREPVLLLSVVLFLGISTILPAQDSQDAKPASSLASETTGDTQSSSKDDGTQLGGDRKIRPATSDTSAKDSNEPTLRSYKISGFDLELAYSIVSEMLADVPGVRLGKDPTSKQLVLSAQPEEHKLVEEALDKLASEAPEFHVIQLKNLDVQLAISVIKKFIGIDDNPNEDNQPIIDGDIPARRLLVRGSRAQVQHIREILSQLDAGDTAPHESSSKTPPPNDSDAASDFGNSAGFGYTGGSDLGIPASAIPGKKWITDGSVIVAIADDQTQVFAYCDRHPRWIAQKLELLPGTKIIPVVGDQSAAVQYGHYCLAFSSTLGSWDTLELPKGELAVPTVGSGSVTVHSATKGDYVFKSSWGKWFSAEDIKAGRVAEYLLIRQAKQSDGTLKIFPLQYASVVDAARIVQQLYGSAMSIAADERTNSLIVRADSDILNEFEALLTRIDTGKQTASSLNSGTPPEASSAPQAQMIDLTTIRDAVNQQEFRLSIAIAESSVSELHREYEELEQRSRHLAGRLRQPPVPDPATGDKLRARLRETVQQAFEVRQALQRAELADFAHRLRDIQQSIETRDSISERIIDRRVRELLDPELDWEGTAPSSVGSTISRTPQ